MFPKAKDITIKASNEETTAIENLFCRYVYALAFYRENDYIARCALKQFFV
jgi:hypothetical protein